MGAKEYRQGDVIPGTPYRFVRTLGQGGYGIVVLVEHEFLETRRAMKLLNLDPLAQDDAARRMTVEAKTLAKIHHPNIVSVLDGGLTDEIPPRPFFIMPYLKGQTLAQMLAHMESGLGVDASLRIMCDLLDGLNHAHCSHGVIHRDLKPANIFMSKEETTGRVVPKILDFGVAHLLGASRVTGKLILGTVRYSAPEYLLGESPTPSSDLYAMGLIFYECLCGKGPFEGVHGTPAFIRAHVQQAPTPPSRVVEVPPEVEQIVLSLLAKRPEERPRSAATLAITLREIRARSESLRLIRASQNDTEPSIVDSVLLSKLEHSDQPMIPLGKDGTDVAPQRMIWEHTAPMRAPFMAADISMTVTPSREQVDRQAPTASFRPRLLPAAMHGTEPIRVDEYEDNVYVDPESLPAFRASVPDPVPVVMPMTSWVPPAMTPTWSRRSRQTELALLVALGVCFLVVVLFSVVLFATTARPSKAQKGPTPKSSTLPMPWAPKV